MKQNAGIFTIMLIMLIFSCKDGTEEVSRVNTRIIDLTVTESNITNYDLWIMAVDMQGDVVAIKRWYKESKLTLNADLKPNEKVNLIFLYGSKSLSVIKSNFIRVYTNVSTGRVWQLGKVSVSPPPTSSLSISINNIPTPLISTTMFATRRNNYTGYSGSCSDNNCTYNFSIYNSPGKSLFSFTPGNADPMYFETDTLQAGKSYSYNFESAFSPFDHVLNVPCPQHEFVTCKVGGITNKVWDIQSVYNSNVTEDEFKIGYNDGFEKYGTYYNARFNEKLYDINVVSSLITENNFKIPEQDFTISNENLSQFSYRVDLKKTLRNHLSVWHKQILFNNETHNLQIFLYGGNASAGLSVKSFPSAITNVYPELEILNEATYDRSSFTFVDDANKDYDAYLESIFDEDISPELETYYQITK